MKKSLQKKQTHTLFLVYLIITVSSWSTLIGNQTTKNNPINFFDQTVNMYLKSFDMSHFDEETKILEHALDDDYQFQKNKLSEEEKRHIIFSLLSEHSVHKNSSIGPVIDKNLLQKMEILCGAENNSISLFSTINRTNTIFGELSLLRWLAQPLTDIQALTDRQEIIQELINNTSLFDELETVLNQIKHAESYLLNYWKEENKINQELYRKVYFGSWLNKLNRNTTALEIGTRFNNALSTAILLEIPSLIWLTGMGTLKHSEASKSFFTAFKAGMQESVKLGKTTAHFLSENCLNPAVISGLSLIIIWKLYLTNRLYQEEKLKNDIALFLQEQTSGVATYLDAIKKLHKLVSANQHLKSLSVITHLFESPTGYSDDFRALVKLLDHDTFKGNPSFFSVTGRVLAAHERIKEVKNEFIPALEAAGELDAYLSAAKLYKEFETKRVSYSFVEFINNDQPSIKAINFWNPMVNPMVVVTNTLEMNTRSDRPANIIITGPNTGGKSTVIKAVTLNILLAQSLGIASAEHLIMTPFSKINTHINITDDISGGTSLFKAEVLRAKALINSITSLKPHEFSFTIMDEVFNSTSPKEGEEAAYMFTQQLGSFNNSLLMLATHFPILTELEVTTSRFKNYQVTVQTDQDGKVLKNKDGKLIRTYKLEEGKSFLNIAMDLLKEEGVL